MATLVFLVDAPKGRRQRQALLGVGDAPGHSLGWRSEVNDGKQQLTQLRLMETITVPDGLYGEKQVQQVRVLTPGAFEIHQKDKKGDFVLIDEGSTSLSEIPFAVAYSNRVGVLESRPPLADIAELNLKAYQVQSDLWTTSCTSAPCRCWPSTGFRSQRKRSVQAQAKLWLCPRLHGLNTSSPEATATTRSSAGLTRLRVRSTSLGLAAVLGQKLSAETAEAKRIDRSQGDSTMMVIAQQMQDLIDNCLKFHAQYMEQPQAGSSFINRDFLGQRLEPQEIQSLLQLYTAGTITQETLLNQLSAGEVLGDEFDVEEEIEATQTGGLIEMEQPEPEPAPETEATMPEAEPEAEDELAG